MTASSPRITLRNGRILVDGVDRGNVLDARFARGWALLDGYATNSDEVADRILALWSRARRAAARV